MWTDRAGFAAAAVLFAAVMAAPVAAQQGPGGPPRRGPGLDRQMRMLTEQLQLTAEQAVSVREILEQQGERRREAMQAAAGDRSAMRSAMEEIRGETDTLLAEVLDETQMQTFRELRQRRAARRPPPERSPA